MTKPPLRCMDCGQPLGDSYRCLTGPETGFLSFRFCTMRCLLAFETEKFVLQQRKAPERRLAQSHGQDDPEGAGKMESFTSSGPPLSFHSKNPKTRQGRQAVVLT